MSLNPEEYVRAIGRIPRVLPRTIRAIRNAATIYNSDKGVELHEVLARVTQLVLRAPTNAAAIVGAVEEMHPIHLDDYPDLAPEELTRFLGPEETTAVLVLSFVSRRLAPVLEPELWEIIKARLRIVVAMGRYVGERVPGVGTGNGMMLAGLPCLAIGTMVATTPEIFSAVRHASDPMRDLLHTAYRYGSTGTSPLEIAATLGGQLGLGATFCNAFLPRKSPLPEASDPRMFHLIELCELLSDGGSVDEARLQVRIEILGSKVGDGLAEYAREVRENHAVNDWIFASALDYLDAEQEI
jgi:hypothetical protein